MVALAATAALVRYHASQRQFRAATRIALTNAPPAAGAPHTRLDINTVPLETIAAVPDLPRAVARAIDDRRTNRPFASMAELALIDGVGARRLETLCALFHCAPPALTGSNDHGIRPSSTAD